MKESRRGSCHCRAVRFVCEIELVTADTSRCNCSMCAKGRFWKVLVRATEFRLAQGAEMLSEYRFGSGGVGHYFCRTCGIKLFGRVRLEDMSAATETSSSDYYAVNVACLDDATDEELASVPVRYEDGRNDDWGRPPAETRHL
jgi:hypothetical protein